MCQGGKPDTGTSILISLNTTYNTSYTVNNILHEHLSSKHQTMYIPHTYIFTMDEYFKIINKLTRKLQPKKSIIIICHLNYYAKNVFLFLIIYIQQWYDIISDGIVMS